MSEGSLAGCVARVVTVSDRSFAGTREDASGPGLRAVLAASGAVVDGVVVPDEIEAIVRALREAASDGCGLVVTTGGTGVAARDVTPEATSLVCERMVPGIAEAMRAEGLKRTKFAALGRGVCGIVGATLVVNVPGSPAGAESSLRAVLELLPHALALLAGATEHVGGEGAVE